MSFGGNGIVADTAAAGIARGSKLSRLMHWYTRHCGQRTARSALIAGVLCGPRVRHLLRAMTPTSCPASLCICSLSCPPYSCNTEFFLEFSYAVCDNVMLISCGYWNGVPELCGHGTTLKSVKPHAGCVENVY